MRTRSRRALGTTCALAALVTVVASPAVAASHRAFPSAEAALTAVVDAAKSGDRTTLVAIFGSDGETLLSSGDPIADHTARNRFVERVGERTHLQYVGDDFAVWSVGNDDWPFAIPLVRDERGWVFDVDAGRVELLNRRIGRNELDTIQVCQEYVAAQRDYARRRQRTDGVAEYAQHLRSTPGKRDGLHWETSAGEEESPLGPLLASASAEGYRAKGGEKPEPFHGYIYRALREAGPHAPGGPRSYIKDGRMTGGFALIAYPVRYGSSGVMTFQVNEQGVVFQKDLGPRTAEIAAAITTYDPDDSWEPAE